MKKLAVFAALLVLSTAAYARDGRPGSSANIATRGGVINSATISQQAGAAAFAQIAQGERAFIDAPKNDPLIAVEPGAFFMPFTGINGDRNNGARVVILDPVGNQLGLELDLELGSGF
jgi:hypothetical protein